MRTQIITVLSIAGVLATAGTAYAVNSTVLSTASSDQSVIGDSSPILVPRAPKSIDPTDDATSEPTGDSDDVIAVPAPSASPAHENDDDSDDNDSDESEDDDSDDDDSDDDSDESEDDD